MDETVVDEAQPQTNDDMSRLIENEHNQEYGEDDSLTTSPNTGNTKKWLIIGAGVLVVGIAIWYFVINKGKTTTAPATNPATPSGRNRTYVYLIQEGATGSPPGPQTTAPPTNVGGQPPTTTPIVTPQPTTTTPSSTVNTSVPQLTPAQNQLVTNTFNKYGFQPTQTEVTHANLLTSSMGTNNIPTYQQVYGGLSQAQRNNVQIVASTESAVARGLNPMATTAPDTTAQTHLTYGELYKKFLTSGYTPSGASAMARNAVANPNAVYPS